MSLKAIGLSRATSRGLINSFNHRILGLEIDLQQLSKERSINKKIYSKRIKLLKNLQSKLQFFQNNFEVQGRKKPHGIFQKQIPERESRSPEETDLCISYFEKSIELVTELIHESNDIVKILQTIFNGRWFQFLTFLDLSKLRKKMLNLENKQETLLQSKNKWNKFVDDVLDKTRVVSLSGFNQTRVQILKNYLVNSLVDCFLHYLFFRLILIYL